MGLSKECFDKILTPFFNIKKVENKPKIKEKIEKYKNHINTLQYISRQNYNDEFFLGLATQYVDSIKQIDNKNKYAADIEKSIY